MNKSTFYFGITSILLLLVGCQDMQKTSSEATQNEILATEEASKEEWLALFNGKDLEGWIPKIKGYELGENFGNTFRVEDGLLKVSYDEYDTYNFRFGHLFYEKPFSHYRLKVEYRFVGEQMPGVGDWAYKNNGVMLHGQAPETMGIDQDFPISLEAQMLGGNGSEERPTGNLCTPGTHVVMNGKLEKEHCIMANNAPTYHGDEWVTLEILALGDSLIQHIVAGKVVMEYSQPVIGGGVVNGYNEAVKIDGTPITGGSISLQSESHPIEFRKVELLNLVGCTDKTAKNYKAYYVKSDNGQCIY